MCNAVALKGSQCKLFTYQSCHHRQYLGIVHVMTHLWNGTP